MASTPSASALSAVLRCRGNIWTSQSVRLTGSTARDLPVKTASLWETFTHGERIVLGRLAVTCNTPWKRLKAPNVSQPARAHSQGHARQPAIVCTRLSLSARRAKVVFVCETFGPSLSLDTADHDQPLWVSVRGACGSLTSLVSHLVLGRLLLLLRPSTGQQDQDTGHSEEPQTPRAAVVDSCPGEGSDGRSQVTEDRPD